MYSSCKKRNKLWLTVALIIAYFWVPDAYGQREITKNAKWSLKDRLYFGGGIGLNGGFSYFNIGLNPVVGYMITTQFSAGLGATWHHLSFPNVNQSINQYGGNIFARHSIFEMLFAYGEYSLLNTPVSFSDQGRVIVSRLPLGLGYMQPLGQRGALNVLALYDILYRHENSNFVRSPWVFRIYFTY